jgi:hypothetical protein
MPTHNKNGVRLLKSTSRVVFDKDEHNLNISRPATGTTIRQNVAASHARVQRVPNAGGSGTIKP